METFNQTNNYLGIFRLPKPEDHLGRQAAVTKDSVKSGPLERQQKIFLESNGVFRWQRSSNDVKCYCVHNQSSHLDNEDICLHGLCICERFQNDKKVKVVSLKSITRSNLPEKYSAHFPTGEPLSMVQQLSTRS
jgi:hypothetical protein